MKLPSLLVALPAFLAADVLICADQPASLSVDATEVAIVFRGGHDTDPRDHGRPVVLVAAALGVPPAVFREAFSHVLPAPAGEQPTPDEVRENKRQLLSRLAPYGVTNERLDEVSNYYRYRRESGELWRHVDAAGYATVKDGKLVSITITQPGAGYTTPPVVSIPGAALTSYPLATLWFGANLAANGSVAKIDLAPIGDVTGPARGKFLPQRSKTPWTTLHPYRLHLLPSINSGIQGRRESERVSAFFCILSS